MILFIAKAQTCYSLRFFSLTSECVKLDIKGNCVLISGGKICLMVSFNSHMVFSLEGYSWSKYVVQIYDFLQLKHKNCKCFFLQYRYNQNAVI